ncbi:type 1 glutamine amidotransferase [Nonomuraea sp. NPDC050783]|uniref:type 1 glutamine amidotransferase n=1 Tax=Nonomuraea sp. NPDC050783 TaxID=3154634 RepID=UPI0034669C4D
MASPRVLVVDNGSLSVKALCHRLESLGTVADVVPCTEVPRKLDGGHQAIVLSGTKVRAYDLEHYKPLIELYRDADVPVLGICGGMHIMGTAAGARLVPGEQRVGNHRVHLDDRQDVFAAADRTVSLFQRHTLYLRQAPPGFRVIGWSEDCPVEFIRSEDGRLIGSQAHLEFRRDGLAILRGFVRLIDTRPRNLTW